MAAAAAGLLLLASTPGTPARTVLDIFEGGIAGWVAAPSDGIRMALSPDAGETGGALRIDFDFQGRAGWAAARKAFPRALPENWAMRFRFKGEGPPQTLEFKLLDPSGENVWWSVRRDFALPRDWTTLTVRKRQVSFAWGPAGAGEKLRELGAIEVTVVNSSGGRGSVWIDDLVLEELPPPGAPLPSRKNWKSAPAAGETAELVLDLGGRRELGGLALFWDAADFARRYEIELSNDGRTWARARSVSSSRGGRSRIYLPDSEAAFVRLRFLESARGRGYALDEVSVEPPETAETPTKFLETLAREAPPGHWPRSFTGEQIYWTVVGTDGGRENGLLSEDGSLESGPGGFSLEPFLRTGDTLLGWREASVTHRLEGDDLPIPSVERRYPGGAALNVTAFADGPPEASTLRARYRVANTGATALRCTLYLALRPIQVNPPTQFLNLPGGFAPIRSVAWDGRAAEVNGSRRVVPLTAPTAFGATGLDDGEIVARLSENSLPKASRSSDPDGFASAAFAWELEIPAGGSRNVVVALPMSGAPLPEHPSAPPAEATDFQALLDAAARSWREKLDRTSFALPGPGDEIARTARANLGWILVNRDGPAIRPGSRAYARSWIRDGALTSVALLRLGHFAEARDFLRWFAPFQYENGAVPCCVDRRGADPVPEHDSHGELLYLASEYFAYTGDRATVEDVWPHLAKAAAHIDALRAKRRTAEYRSGEKRFFFGLLPESISHEGYSSRPVHSYWDDLWAVRGLTGAADLARALGKAAEAARIAASRDEMRRDLHASIRAVIEARGLDFIPGSADLGDLDPTSTTIAFEPCGEASRLPQLQLARTFERYWESFVARRAVRREPAHDYTPYEWRVAGTYVRLGRRDRAQALFQFFFGDRRPHGWKQWAEVVGPDPRAPRFIGDMPHGWVGSDFLRSFLDLFVYDREEDGALVLGAGVPAAWLADPRGVSIGKIRTRYGPLDLAMTADSGAVRVRIGGGLSVPPGGLVVPWPLDGRAASATVNGRAAALSAAGELVVREVPADIVIEKGNP
ncbi:MAG: discoidin domain-containing protein [Thermoanaerobaculia bacterium]